ncbi:MAG: hypothetical protein OIF48_03365 [Silicimonas sp.]|nr:hypothetical protein [Silicimonas sp.]
MVRRLLSLGFAGMAALSLVGCGIPPVDTTLISQNPADAQDFSIAKRAVNACKDLRRDKVRASFLRAGFKVSEKTESLSRNRTLKRLIIQAPSDRVSVFYHGGSCWVGLEGMTPAQSRELASIWVRAHDAKPNSAFGDGLSDHVSGAWRHFFVEPPRFPDKAAYRHRIYIAAYKTWPYGPYDPQNQYGFDIGEIFPAVPGAAVELNHVTECQPIAKTSDRSGAFLPCSGPAYRPR